MADAELPHVPRYLAAAPLTHATGLGVLPALLRGGTVVVEQGFDPGRFLDIIEAERINWTNAIPTMKPSSRSGRCMPDGRLGERNCLCAIFKPGQSITLDEVVGVLKGRVADYKLPEQLEVMTEFPMTPSGKIRRPELVKQLLAKA